MPAKGEAEGYREYVRQELERYADVLARVMFDDLDIRASSSDGNEFGCLTMQLNTLIASLQRKDAELREHRERLEELVRERTRELHAKNEQLREEFAERKRLEAGMIESAKMSAVGRLAAGMAHEINNPLGAILIFAQGALRRTPEDDPLRRPLASIERESQRCKRLVQALLAYSRPSKGEPAPLDIGSLTQEALELVGNKAKLASVEVRFEPTPDLPKIMGDRVRLEQVLLNIAHNALDAMPEGGVLSISTGRRGHEVWVRLADTGPGMEKEVGERLFEPFFTTKETGTGLGLSIAYETVRRHAGRIEVESELGKGSVFTVRLPVDKEHA